MRCRTGSCPRDRTRSWRSSSPDRDARAGEPRCIPRGRRRARSRHAGRRRRRRAGFRKRFAQQPARLDERREAWRELLAARGREPVFVDLADARSAAVDAALERSLDARRGSGMSAADRADRTQPDLAHERGKTTLARTLLERNVGEVRDAPTSPRSAEPHAMIEDAEGDVLRLWDTPGFGDSARLAKRLAAAGQSDRLVPDRGLGPLARPAVLVEPAGDAQRPRAGRRRALSRQRRGGSRRRGLRRAGDARSSSGSGSRRSRSSTRSASRARARSSRPRRRAGAPTRPVWLRARESSRSMHSRAAGCRRWRCCVRSARRCPRRSARRSSGSQRRGRRGGWRRSKRRSKRSPSQLARAACDREAPK